MELKKTNKANLEQKRSIFLQIGFVIALGAALVAFEWKTIRTNPGMLADNALHLIDEELPPVIRIKEPEPEKPKPKLIVLEELIIVEDETELPGDELEINSESLEDLSVALQQVEPGEEDGDPIPFIMLEDKPEFPGGERALLKYLSSSVKYPIIAVENGIEGTVYLSFIISKTGKVEQVQVIRGVNTLLDREALRVVSSMPNWKPGRQGTRKVAVSYQVPIKFKLQ
ncbi:protein TonB [Saccharicrinis carchari]|uniref:Protein TonB n=1 Tax=Saccharicrinis carchari TaxID=1168039 RepID=A0A521E714_SACCC|nr:energy transducer TonB [Saccharicrinis carchari]SMO79685.1 protein TonB [Saccharicrinis carchari]